MEPSYSVSYQHRAEFSLLCHDHLEEKETTSRKLNKVVQQELG